jgi:hypothetical protein
MTNLGIFWMKYYMGLERRAKLTQDLLAWNFLKYPSCCFFKASNFDI